MREVSPQDSSELQPKIGALNDSGDESLFALAKARGSKLCMGVLRFHSCGGSTLGPEQSHSAGVGKSLVSDAIRNFLTRRGWWFSNVLKAQLPFSSSGFVDPLSIGRLLTQKQEKFALLPWKR